jgi:hypothetical protein
MESIEVVIKKNGEVSYTVKGVKGSGCKNLTKAIDDLGRVTESKKTGEYFEGGPGIHLTQGL